MIWAHPELLPGWRAALRAEYGSPLMMIAAAMIVFPKLALGLSGFETGVAVMPLVKGDPTTRKNGRLGRIRNTKKLLLVAALIMSVLLMASSIVTTVLIPADVMLPGGQAAGRALAYLAHEHLGNAVRHDLRHRHGRDAVVCRRIGTRRSPEPGAPVPAAIRHGARNGRARTGRSSSSSRSLPSS